MRKIEDVLRLHYACGRTNREIARAVRAVVVKSQRTLR